jgi:hypothetical protein
LVPLLTRDVNRDAVVINGNVAGLLLVPHYFPADVTRVVLRVQTLTRSGSSAWSEPSPPTESVVYGAAARTSARKRPQISLSDVARHPQLEKVLRTVVPSTEKLSKIVSEFRTIEELAMAAVLNRDHDIPLDRLSKTMAGPPRRSLRNALREVKPTMSDRRELQSVRAVALKLIDRPKGFRD